MSVLKGNEKFVAESLTKYFNKTHTKVDFREGEDPPDIYLNMDGEEIAIEITDLSENVLKNRKNLDTSYLNFINNLDKEFSALVPSNIKIHILFFHHYKNVSRISNDFKTYFKQLLSLNDLTFGTCIEDSIKTVNFKITFFKQPKHSSRKIAGAVTPYGGKRQKTRDINTISEQLADCHLSSKGHAIVLDRILDKTKKCHLIKKPIWLALFDTYYSHFTTFQDTEHITFYRDILNKIDNFGIFEKILIVFENQDVLEFPKSK